MNSVGVADGMILPITARDFSHCHNRTWVGLQIPSPASCISKKDRPAIHHERQQTRHVNPELKPDLLGMIPPHHTPVVQLGAQSSATPTLTAFPSTSPVRCQSKRQKPLTRNARQPHDIAYSKAAKTDRIIVLKTSFSRDVNIYRPKVTSYW